METENKNLLSSKEYYRKKQIADEEKNYLKDYCDHIVRRLITELVRTRPEDVLDHMSKWVCKERGVPLSEVEAEVLDHVKKNRIKRDERKYVLERRRTFQTHVSEEPVLPNDSDVLNKQLSLPGDEGKPADSNLQQSGEQAEEDYIEDSDQEFKANTSVSKKQRRLRLLNACLTFKTFSKELKSLLADKLVEASFV